MIAAELFTGPAICEVTSVKRSIHLCRLLAVFLIVGLVIAPLSVRANAATSASMAMASISADIMSADIMSADVPCCPDESAPMDCDHCPLMAICMVKTLQAQSPAGVVEVQPVTLRMLLPPSDRQADSLGHLPPPKPPRSLVRSA